MEIGSLKWIGHASFILEGKERRVYIDPFGLGREYGRADVIFVTHPHFDHFCIEDIRKIADAKTEFVVPPECGDKLDYKNVKAVRPGDVGKTNGIQYSVVCAYNTNAARLGFHPKANNWNGYIINFEGTTFYHAGDTDAIDEMKDIDVDVALLPVGGTYTMDVNEAIKAASLIRAKTFVPMHYKALLHEDGSGKAESIFTGKIKNSVILKEIQQPRYSFQ